MEKEIEKSLTKEGKKYLKEKGKLPITYGSLDAELDMLDSATPLKVPQPAS